jgi:hypothetical protein
MILSLSLPALPDPSDANLVRCIPRIAFSAMMMAPGSGSSATPKAAIIAGPDDLREVSRRSNLLMAELFLPGVDGVGHFC